MVDAWQRHRFFEGLTRAVFASSRPTLLVLDDIQWCDADTLTWMQMLFRLADKQPLLVLASDRMDDAEDNPPLAQALRATQPRRPHDADRTRTADTWSRPPN